MCPWTVLTTNALSILRGGAWDEQGLWDPGGASALGALTGREPEELLGPPPRAGITPGWKGQQEAAGAPTLRPLLSKSCRPRQSGPTARSPVRTWSFSPTFTIIMSPTISIQLVPQGLCELTPLRNHTWESQKQTCPLGGSLK